MLNFYLVELGGGAVDKRCVRDGGKGVVGGDDTDVVWESAATFRL